MLSELQGEIADSGVRAAWIKLSAGDRGLSEVERKILRAAARAGAESGAVIGSHTRLGRVVHEQIDLVEEAGYTPERFIWVHAQNDALDLNLEVAGRGAWIEYDAIGDGNRGDAFWLGRIQRMLQAGYASQVLLSHDRGWYDPAQPGGGIPRPFTYISEVFLPKLRAESVDEITIRKLTRDNPFRAFAR
jgi:phosphotriesterase-related protein